MAADPAPSPGTAETIVHAPANLLAGVGEKSRSVVAEVGSLFWFLINTISETVDRMRRGRVPFRAASFFRYTERAGVGSVPLVAMVSFFLGLTMALLTGDQLVGPLQHHEEPLHLSLAQDQRTPLRPLRPRDVAELTERLLEHSVVQKNERIERLLLRARGNILSHRQMSEEKLHFQSAHFRRMLFSMIKNEAPNPTPISLLGPQ